ncbi:MULTISPECIES: phosphomannomutase/phosphoglucomutase [unclassified Saccharopolyspora]|uniref:phosphomannomutase/phosphoglucomutase n=1 Tax=unclassified Saccharopolyspora TaxID=2646250 RepID=UPI001CD3D57E|nr:MULTISPECIES: phosphomannomutase/phosphoglucomutase [unclassified Saccharopolyspora]MCA1188702.1 phosphomannomutase/phosphoglucomutase [Saccharopolyspora sp. 6T]MCA1195040.1 phosphomannomutase/phosphoglucomutase [Saccharopolyspora sp. 6V]MCA1227689.1 phosphomannomutase/phosphoglucomutase [Saccharopolyspora sp. 6M]MCA1279233.1 phosphomannomutase/phosphoglucomutase [Saccharopolyspora sp. 7B]
MRDLSEIVKAYDIRGVVDEQLDADVVREIGAAFTRLVGGPAVVVGHDMRDSSPGLAAAFAEGVTGQGVDVISIGLASTDMLYFASGTLELPGAMFTASHNPARYNGIKLCRAGAAPVGQDSGLSEIQELVSHGVPEFLGAKGSASERDMLAEYAEFLRGLVDLSGIRPLKVVVDAGNGMAGHTVPKVFDGLPVEVVPMYFELDGDFPNHEANPLDPANLVDLQAKVREVGADAGLAFDGDADRCFVVDENADPVAPSAITALVAVRELAKEPGATVIHNLITSHAVPEIVAERGGKPVRTRVGHSFIKQTMAETGAIFGGEHSAHYYFRDFWKADSGMLAALHVLAALGGQDGALSGLMAEYSRYAASGEINSTVDDQAGRMRAVAETYRERSGARIDELDGLTVELADGSWFNIRPSNTEPLLRLNVEAPDAAAVAALRDEVLAVVRG